MKTIKIYSKDRPKHLTGKVISCEVFSVSSNGIKTDSMTYTEIEADYFTTRLELEQRGFIAHPESIKEIESTIYTIFKETV
jgi:hypothetical protein